MQPTNLDQQEILHDKLLTDLLELLNVGVQGMTLETASRTLIDFAAGALFYAHQDVERLDLLNPMYEADRLAQIIVALKQGRETTPRKQAKKR